MAKSIQQQIENEKTRLANEKIRLEKEAAAAEQTAANKKKNAALRKKIAAYQADLNYISSRIKPYINKIANNDTLSVTEKSIFDGLSEQFDLVRDKISVAAFPGATKPGDTKPNLSVIEKPKPTTAAKPTGIAGVKSEPLQSAPFLSSARAVNK
jgi:hypothetical protein